MSLLRSLSSPTTPASFLLSSTFLFFCILAKDGLALLDDDCHTLRIDRIYCRRVTALGATSVGHPCSSLSALIATFSQSRQSLD